MSIKTLVATIAFLTLTTSLMMDNPEFASESVVDVKTEANSDWNYDFALTSQKLVFSENLFPLQYPKYLVSNDQWRKFSQRSTQVILSTLEALPHIHRATAIHLSQNSAGSNSLKQ